MSRPMHQPHSSVGIRRADDLDRQLGARIHRRRRALGISSTTLGAAVGVSHQQIRRYERGQDRMAASMLLRLGAALDISVGDLCTGIDTVAAAAHATVVFDPIGTPERLVTDFEAIQDKAVQRRLAQLMASLAMPAPP